MKKREQFIKQFFTEIAEFNYTYLNFIEGNLDNIGTQTELALLIDSEKMPQIDTIIKNNELVDHTVMIAMSNMHQFSVLLKDGTSIDIDCMFKLTRKGMVYLSNEFIQKNTAVRDGIKCCNNKCFFELRMLYHQLNEAGMPENYCNYFKALSTSDSIIAEFNEKYHASFNLNNIGVHNPDFKSSLRMHLSMMRDNVFGESLRNTLLYARDECTRVLSRREQVTPFATATA